VKVPCESFHGHRFDAGTLAVSWRGKSIGEVLQMEVDEAVEFFASMPSITHPLQLLKDVGLGYLTLGQPSPTFSGGEAQRIKLVTKLPKVRDDATRRSQNPPHTLYVLDEPTVGLHMVDVEKLIRVLHRLVDGGHSVVVIEHDLDVIAEADWVIDLGPEGSGEGGRVVLAGRPEQAEHCPVQPGLGAGHDLHPDGARLRLHWAHKMSPLVHHEWPTVSVGSSQVPNPQRTTLHRSATRPESTYRSGKAVQTDGATSPASAHRKICKPPFWVSLWSLALASVI
jgi:hypothetical protein